MNTFISMQYNNFYQIKKVYKKLKIFFFYIKFIDIFKNKFVSMLLNDSN